MEFGQLVSTIRDTLSARRVFGEPVERDGVVVIPAAVVMGGGGGGAGTVDGGPQEGGGFGLLAWPVGAFVISNGTARWVPSIDVNVLGMVAAMLAAALLGGRRRRHKIK
ncbi:MAG TPA: sporulation protein [Pseudonocardiaceae bacterium]